MKYAYKCPVCKQETELEKGMKEEFTESQLRCHSKLDCCGILQRDYTAESSSKTTLIPEHMKGINMTESDFKYDRSPSGKKHFW
jgi:hypothetical protein